MPLIRGYHEFDDQFAQIPNAWLRDSRLSLKAIGLLAQILSHSPGWAMSIVSLAGQNQVGKDQIRSAIAELEKFGYLKREQTRDESNRFAETIWTPSDPAGFPSSAFPTSGNPTVKNNNIKKTNIKNNERIYSDSESSEFDTFWNLYPKKVDKGAAIRAFRRALKRETLSRILEGAKAFAEDPNLPEKQFIKNPATWLNADAWLNPPLPARSKTDKKAIEDWAND